MKTGWAAACALLVVAGTAWAAPPDASKIAAEGNGHGAAACASCHGKDGGGQAAAGFPRLAGLDAAYLERQLNAFADGTRDIPAMAAIAKALTPAERHELAGYYSHLPIPAAAAHGASKPPNDQLGKELATRGTWSKQVPGCDKCHGPDGVGVGADFPPLAGQPATYIVNQLRSFKDGRRKNDPLGLMQHIASALSDEDMQAVAAWYAAQPAGMKGTKP